MPAVQQVNQPGYQDPRYVQNAYYQPVRKSQPQQQQNYVNQQVVQGSQIQQRVQPPSQVPQTQAQSSVQQPVQGTHMPQQYQQHLAHGTQIQSQYANQQTVQGSHLPHQAQQHLYPNLQQSAHRLQAQQQPIQGSQPQQQQGVQGPSFQQQQQYTNQQPPEPQLQQQMPQQQQYPSQGPQIQQQADVNVNATQQPQLMDEFSFDNLIAAQTHQQTQNSRYINQQVHYPQSAAVHQNSMQPPVQYYSHQQPAPIQDNQQVKGNLQIPEHLRQHRRQVSDPNQISNLIPVSSVNTPNRVETRARPSSSVATFASAPASPRSSPPNVRRSVHTSQSLNVTLNRESHKGNNLSHQGDTQNSQNRDLFGAAPFGSTSSSGSKAKDAALQQKVVTADAQKDLFGAAPFSAEPHGEVVVSDDSNNQLKNSTDLFGAKPFTVDNSAENSNPPVDTTGQKRMSMQRQESDVFDAIPFGDEIDEFSSLSQSRLQNSSNPGSRPSSLAVDENDAFGNIPFGDSINKDVSEKLHLFSLSSSRSNSSIASNSSAEV